MSIQDDLFDVTDKVKGTDAEEAFDRICSWANQLEADLDVAMKERSTLINAIKIVKNSKYE